MEKVVGVLLLGVVTVQSCSKYTCETPDLAVEAGTCAAYVPALDTYYMKPCLTGYECEADATPSLNRTCVRSAPALPAPAYPGEPCNYDSDCFYFTTYGVGYGCVKDLCQGQKVGGGCKAPAECAPGLTCFTGACTALAKAKEKCMSDTDCVASCGCDIPTNSQSPGTCVPYFSVPANTTISACPGQLTTTLLLPSMANLNYLCESGSCITSTGTTTSMCVNPIISSSKLPMNCTISDTTGCTAGNAPGINGKCACGMESTGTAYCPLFPGDSYFSQYISQAKSWLTGDDPETCNTIRRMDCMPTVSSSAYIKLMYYSLSTLYYTSLVFADKCTAEVMFPQYYAVKEEYDAAGVVTLGVLLAILSS